MEAKSQKHQKCIHPSSEYDEIECIALVRIVASCFVACNSAFVQRLYYIIYCWKFAKYLWKILECLGYFR